jgi:hypothetical protein
MSEQSVDNIVTPRIEPRTRDHRREGAIRIILQVFGPKGPPLGLMERDRNLKINGRAKELGIAVLSDSTIRRALKKMRSA